MLSDHRPEAPWVAVCEVTGTPEREVVSTVLPATRFSLPDEASFNGKTLQRNGFNLASRGPLPPRIQRMSRLLLLVLCLLMPLQGHAATGVQAAPCPMQGGREMDLEAEPGSLAQAMDDCCNDIATFERTGEACKSTQVCGAPVAGSVPSFALGLLVQTTDPPPPLAWRSLPPSHPTPHWRPPAST